MPLKIYNSLTKRKEDFVPLQGKTVRMYSCGVTVYDDCHIGHARSLYIFDVIRRYLKFRGYDLQFVRNITDVDDKIINRANELKQDSAKVAQDNIDKYYRDLKSLSIDTADIEPRATDNIDGMIVMIQALIAKGLAYASNGSVYYSVKKFNGYGKLSGQSVDYMMEAVRIEPDDDKKDPLDFALWKASRPGEPAWASPWGQGRPGWHIECSCMSLKYLNCETLDIHAGGRDLIFPHHENEIAQSEAVTGKPFAKYWIHHGLLTINGQKMSKSLGNFITVQDCLKKYHPDQLKMLFLMSHYGSPVDYTDAKMEEAHRALQRFDVVFNRVNMLNATASVIKSEWIRKAEHHFMDVMDDDFNTAKALGVLFEFVNDINTSIDNHTAESDVVCARDVLQHLLKDVLGLFQKEKVVPDLSADAQKLLRERLQARCDKNWKRSDEIRGILKNHGILVEDGKQGQTWRRV